METKLNQILYFLLHFHEQANFRDFYEILDHNLKQEHLTDKAALKKLIRKRFLDASRNPYPLLYSEENLAKIKQKLEDKADELNKNKKKKDKIDKEKLVSSEDLKDICEEVVWEYTEGTLNFSFK